jgi:Xaa-Pro dipeptidase
MMKQNLPFKKEEYQERLRKVREQMDGEGVELLMLQTPANLTYLTGYHTTGHYKFQALLVPLQGDMILVSRELERANVLDRSCVDRYISYLDEENPIDVVGKLIKKERFNEKILGLEMDSRWFLASTYLDLMKYVAPNKVKATYGLVTKVRSVKSEAEIGYMREAAKITEKGIIAGVEAIEEGRTDNDVAAEVFHSLICNGSDYLASNPYVVAGKESYRGHATFERRPMKKGDIVFFEVSGIRHRYAAANIRTAVLGKASDTIKRAFDASMDALENALSVARPGVSAEEVDAACRQVIEEAGFGEYYNHRSGYHIGLEWGDQSGFSLHKGFKNKLEKGQTFHIIPGLLITGTGHIGVSETVLIKEDGCEVLTTTPRKLFIK